MQCSNCGTENGADAKFCGGCGRVLARACPACGKANAPGMRFCTECGSALDADLDEQALGGVEERLLGLVSGAYGDLRHTTYAFD